MPPTLGDFIRAKNSKEGLKELRYNVPLVNVINTVDVNVENTPLYVEKW